MSNKFSVNLAFDIVNDANVEELSQALSKLLKDFADDNYLFVNQLSIYQLKNPVTGDPLDVEKDGSVKVKKFEIKNLITDVL